MSYLNCQNCGGKKSELYKLRASDFRKNYENILEGDIYVCQNCRDCFNESEEGLKKILSSDDKHKLVLGGPGTGKTHLFKNIIENLPKESNVLVITFINNLAEDLEKRLNNISDREIIVRTLHSFCKSFLLQNIHPFEYLPELPKIIVRDAFLLEMDYEEKNATQDFINLKEGEETKFYLSRSEYYNSVSHDDAVLRVFNYLCKNENAIPQYSQVIIDEFQDFNLLESSLIELLAQKNMIIIAGDDDQSLYRFKSASPKFIRKLHREEQFTNFYLPFCRRCSLVLLKATNAFICNAKERGLLGDRIEKEFKCYWPDKFIDSHNYPFIFLGKFTRDSIVLKFIKEKILTIIEKENIQPREEEEAEFLIVGPPRISQYLKNMYSSLTEDTRFDPGIFEIKHKKELIKFSINEGYRLIKDDMKSNLGWRIVMYMDPIDPTFKMDKEIISRSLDGEPLIDFLPEEYISQHIENAHCISQEDVENPEEIPDKKIKIKLTNYLGAKGLSSNHVFILGLENNILPKNPYDITDDEICQFIVLLTRARKSLDILVSKRFDRRLLRPVDRLSCFISMIPRQVFKFEHDINASNFGSKI